MDNSKKSNTYTHKHKHTKDKQNKTKKFKALYCSPGKKQEFSCYNDKSLHKIKSLWNKRHTNNKIVSNDLRTIWGTLKENMDQVCDNEKCWLSQQFMENHITPELQNYTFAPKMPSTWKKSPNEWLNSNDINIVMKQYEHAYPFFQFIGPSPIDFDKKKMFGQCIWNDLCNFNIVNFIKRGKNKIGIILNLDPHYLEGSHWVCIFIDLKKNYIYYFDSNADKTPKEVTDLINRIKTQAYAIGKDLKYYTNTTEHQKTNTECGMYTLYVISQLLTNQKTPHDFKKRVPDEVVKKYRKLFFNEEQ